MVATWLLDGPFLFIPLMAHFHFFFTNYLTLFCRTPASRRRGLQSTETFGFVSGLPTGNQTSMTIPAPALLPSGNSAQVDAGCQNLVTTLMSGSACSGGHLQFDFAE